MIALGISSVLRFRAVSSFSRSIPSFANWYFASSDLIWPYFTIRSSHHYMALWPAVIVVVSAELTRQISLMVIFLYAIYIRSPLAPILEKLSSPKIPLVITLATNKVVNALHGPNFSSSTFFGSLGLGLLPYAKSWVWSGLRDSWSKIPRAIPDILSHWRMAVALRQILSMVRTERQLE